MGLIWFDWCGGIGVGAARCCAAVSVRIGTVRGPWGAGLVSRMVSIRAFLCLFLI